MFVPFVGSIAYIGFELLPEMANTRRGRKVASDVTTLNSPDAEWRRLRQLVNDTDSAEAKIQFAEACVRQGMWSGEVRTVKGAANGKVEEIHVTTGGMLGFGGRTVAIPGGKFNRSGSNVQLAPQWRLCGGPARRRLRPAGGSGSPA